MSKEALKLKFATGKKPTGNDFAELIEGVVGPQGLQGPTGPKGDTGATGPQGPKGDTGNTGPAGVTGAAGATWLQGTAAPTTQGKTGDFYLNTATFDVYSKVTGSWVLSGNIKGATGATGAAGAAGAKGDKGDKGDPGAAGAAGTPGAKGDKGDTGAQGPAGLGVKAIAITTDGAGIITGGTVTFTNDTTAPITITTA